MARDELVLIKELLPIWQKYTDGFIFFLDSNTDDTKEFLLSVKEKYNILEIIEHQQLDNELPVETNNRQILFDAAKKYSNKIICLDADEYLDGNFTKEQLENVLDQNPNTVFHLRWIQYVDDNKIRIDGPWNVNYKDRIGHYIEDCKFSWCQMHSTHLPIPQNQKYINIDDLFIAHLQWLDKEYVAVKQYYWKTIDFVNKLKYNVNVVGNAGYDSSVNNFKWEEINFNKKLKINKNIVLKYDLNNHYRLKKIKEYKEKYNIPNLGDWGYNII